MFLAFSVFSYFLTASVKITISQNRDAVHDRIINSATEIANENFNYRKVSVFLSKDVEGYLIDDFLEGFKGCVVIETKNTSSPRQVIILVGTIKSYIKILRNLKRDQKGKAVLENGGKFLIVLLRNSKEINLIAKTLWSYKATNAIIISNVGNKTALYTYFPYKNHLNCQNTDPSLIGYWKEDSLAGKEIYSDKMINMKGCPLYVSTNKLYHPSTEQKIPLQIVKKTLLRLLRDKMNFTPIISARDYISIDSSRAQNWSDSLNDVISGLANISTSSIPLGIDSLGLLDYSMPYFRVRLAWWAPPVSPGPIWWRLLSPLNGYLWLILLILLLFLTSLPFALKLRPVKKFCLKYFKHIDEVRSVTIRVWGVMLGQPIRVAPRRFRDFYILSLWIWFTFVIRSAYQSVLIGALKTETLTGAFLDLDEIIDHGYSFGGREGVYAYFEQDPLIRQHFKIIKEGDFEKTFHNVVERREKFVLATSLEYAWAYCLAAGKKEMECGHVLPDSIMTVPLVIWMKIYSPFRRPIAVWLPRLIETGLLDRDARVKPECCLTKTTDPTPLTKHQILSCMLCLLLGYLISSAVFLLELLRYKTKKIKFNYHCESRFAMRKNYPFHN